jgi:hypothetical protein
MKKPKNNNNNTASENSSCKGSEKRRLPMIDGRRVAVVLRETLQRETFASHDQLLVNDDDAVTVAVIAVVMLLGIACRPL